MKRSLLVSGSALLLIALLARSWAPRTDGVALKPAQPLPRFQPQNAQLKRRIDQSPSSYNTDPRRRLWDTFGGLSRAPISAEDLSAGKLVQQALIDWAACDPIAVISWLVSDDEDSTSFGIAYPFERRDAVGQIFATLPISLLPDCLSILRRHNDAALSSAIYSAVISGKLAAKEVLENIAFYATETMTNQLAGAVLAAWGDVDAGAAKQWIVQQPDIDARASGIVRLGVSLLATDPPASITWVEDNVSDSLKPGTIEFLVSSWFDIDPIDVGHWLQMRMGDPVVDDAVGIFAQKIRDSDPNAAVKWALTIVDPDKRRAVLASVQPTTVDAR